VREQGLERMGGTEVESDERELSLDDRADLDQLESDGLAGGFCEFSVVGRFKIVGLRRIGSDKGS